MKKRSFNAADVFIIIILIACVVGITVRAFSLTGAYTVKNDEYHIKFTAKLDLKQLEELSSGIVLTDGNTEFKLLEGYWITKKENTAALNGELLVSGRLTEKGFETSGGYYYKNDVIALKNGNITFNATLTDFAKQ